MSHTRCHVPVLIIGSGVAGCTAALTLADAGHEVLLISAGDNLGQGNSELAQGGIIYRAATDDTEAEARALEHDIMVAGHRYNSRSAVRQLCRQGPVCVDEMLLERARVQFDRNPDGSFNLTREGGHGAPRILHRADYSGKAIMDGLTAQVAAHPRITRLFRRAAIDLLTSRHHDRITQYRYSITNRCLGAYVLNEESGEPETILADWTVLATGGVGQVFLHSTNAPGYSEIARPWPRAPAWRWPIWNSCSSTPRPCMRNAATAVPSSPKPCAAKGRACWTKTGSPSCCGMTSAATWPRATSWRRP